MRRSGLSKAPLCIALLPLAALAQPWLTHEGDLWVRTYNDTAPVKPRVRINSHGPVLIEGNSSPAQFVFTVKVAVRARTQEEARVWLEKLQVRAESQGEWLVVTTPGGYASSSVVMHAPRLIEAYVTSSDGQVEVNGVDGPLHVDTGANQIKVDRIHGDCALSTGGGDIQAGRVDGSLYCTTVAGAIRSQLVAAMVVAPKASRLERNTMASCFSASHISTRRNSTGSSPSRFSRGKQMIWSRTTLLFCGTCNSSFTS